MAQETEPQMEAEPVLVVDGVRSDASIHAAFLENDEANGLSDSLATNAASELGFSDEEIKKLFGE